jgi:hypothetical protein
MPISSQNKSIRSKTPPKGWIKQRRVAAYKAPPVSTKRRLIRWVFNGWTASAAALFVLAALLTLTYFWFEFSDRIDRKLLSGEVFTPSAGIYSAPKTLRVGEPISRIELIEYLKSAGYVDKNAKADLFSQPVYCRRKGNRY